MATDRGVHGHHAPGHVEPHASSNKWRHQESTAFAQQATAKADQEEFLDAVRSQQSPAAGADSHVPAFVGHTGSNHAHGSAPADVAHEQVAHSQINGNGALASDTGATSARGDNDRIEVKCGPLLNYRRMDNGTWYGSVLVVLAGKETFEPVLKYTISAFTDTNRAGTDGQHIGHTNGITGVDGTDNGQDVANGHSANGISHGQSASGEHEIKGIKLYADQYNTFWRFKLVVNMEAHGIVCQYTIPSLKYASTKAKVQTFHVSAVGESMRIMFHSCNGFSVGTDEEAWSGPALWNDVRRVHAETPLHVMLGGGDQIYNDGIRVHGPLRKWTSISNPIKRREHPFPEELRKECDQYYVKNYLRWYSTEPFAASNGMIPQINLWDDHDIIDGFGSYVDEFMRCNVFRGIGGVAHKYYLLFQHHLAPPASTFTTDAPETMNTTAGGKDPQQMENTYVHVEKEVDPSYVIGPKPGPYVAEHSRSIVTRLGARIGFFGIDARTERTRHQVNYPETYELIFKRLRDDLSAAANSSSPIKHLIVLLGIPIAYPRLTWLENLFGSPIMGPIKFLNKRFGFGGSFFNSFDGSIDLLDDLDDHYTARTHKKERLFIVNALQSLAAEYSVRVTILGGDVHLAAVGRFYSNPKLDVPVTNDHRYMANIISSAIVNKPPPQPVANLLARRNKIHHLDHHTDETLLKYFDKDPGGNSKTTAKNHVTMPSRNWAMITENTTSNNKSESDTSAHVNGTNGVTTTTNGNVNQPTTNGKPRDGHSTLHDGEISAGTTHKAAQPSTAAHGHGCGNDGGLDVSIRVEIDQHDKEGKTQAYGMTVPILTCEKSAHQAAPRRRDAVQDALSHHQKEVPAEKTLQGNHRPQQVAAA